MITDSAVSKYATPGGDMRGGRGGDGKEGGGGGGAGFFGGGGGGSGVDGAGGGGGCGYIDYAAVYRVEDHAASNRGHGRYSADTPAPPVVFGIRPTAFSLQWTHPLSNGTEVLGYDVRAYNVELSAGRVGSASDASADCTDDFYTYRQIRVNVDSPHDSLKITDLAPNTLYCVRIAAVSRSGVSVATAPALVPTLPPPVNEWEVVPPRRLKSVISGRGDASGVMTRPHVHPNVEVRGASKRADDDRTFDGPFEVSQKLH